MRDILLCLRCVLKTGHVRLSPVAQFERAGGFMQRLKGIVGTLAGSLAMTIALAAQTPPATTSTQAPAGAPPGQGQGRGPQPPKNLKVLPKTWTGQQVR